MCECEWQQQVRALFRHDHMATSYMYAMLLEFGQTDRVRGEVTVLYSCVSKSADCAVYLNFKCVSDLCSFAHPPYSPVSKPAQLPYMPSQHAQRISFLLARNSVVWYWDCQPTCSVRPPVRSCAQFISPSANAANMPIHQSICHVHDACFQHDYLS